MEEIMRAFLALLLTAGLAAAKAPLDYIDPLIGTDGDGSEYGGMFPGVCRPFSAVQWVCMTRLSELGRTSYRYADKQILGFIGTRQPAIWMGDWGQVSFMPELGEPDGNFDTRGKAFDHKDETASPWFYSVGFGGIRVEVTGTEKSGLFRITAPSSERLSLVVDASRDFAGGCTDRRPADGWIQIGKDGLSVVGWNRDRMDAAHAYELPNFRGYFVMRFSRPFSAFGTCVPDGGAPGGKYQRVKNVPGAATAQANRVGGYVTFGASAEPLLVRVGTSLISLEQAQANLDEEIPPGRSFGDAAAANKAVWQKQFDRVVIETPEENVKTIFYTGLYHALLYPRDITEDGRYYSAFDDKVHAGTSYTSFSMWDTYRAEHALLTLVASERVDAMMTTLLQDYREGGWLPMWPNPSYTGIMIGGPAEMILAEAWAKGFRGFDVDLAYEAVRKNAMQPQLGDENNDWRDRGDFGHNPETRGGLSWYEKLGYVPCDKVRESVSRTQDFALDDTAAAVLAKATGHMDDAAFFLARSKSYTNVWCRERQLFLPRKADGSFIGETRGGHYCETSAETALWCVPHDPLGAAALLGGKDVFERKLDDFFGKLFFKNDGRGNLSIHGNEPSHHVAYLYNKIGRPAKTQRQVREIMARCYTADKRGFDGNEDCGQMSAWYILSALGFYPLNPASGEYEIGSPNVAKAVLRFGAPYPAATLTILVHNAGPKNVYVKSVTLNGHPLKGMRITQSEIVGGGTLEFTMAAEE
jgi:predicted alpha-1,2-mannosidase